MSVIIDGTGSGSRAAVTSDNRLKTDAITEDSYTAAAETGFAFNINTEQQTYSGTGPFSADALYIKNDGANDLEMVGWFIGEINNRSGGSTTQPLLFEVYGNPEGTPSGTAAAVVNRRIGAAKEFDITAISKPTGLTTTGSPLLYQYHYGSRGFGLVNFTLPPGQSLVICVDIACDSLDFYTGFTGYEKA